MREAGMQPEMMRQTQAGIAGNGAAAREPQLRALAEGALRCAARAPGPEDTLDVRELMRQMCAVAHECDLRAEQLLLLVKETWRHLPEGRHLPHPDGDAVLARAITVCIDEYYAQVRGAGD